MLFERGPKFFDNKETRERRYKRITRPPIKHVVKFLNDWWVNTSVCFSTVSPATGDFWFDLEVVHICMANAALERRAKAARSADVASPSRSACYVKLPQAGFIFIPDSRPIKYNFNKNWLYVFSGHLNGKTELAALLKEVDVSKWNRFYFWLEILRYAPG